MENPFHAQPQMYIFLFSIDIFKTKYQMVYEVSPKQKIVDQDSNFILLAIHKYQGRHAAVIIVPMIDAWFLFFIYFL